MKFLENYSFSNLCSLKINECVAFYCELETEEQLSEISAFVDEKGIKFCVIGEGTNIVPIKKFQGLLIKNKLSGTKVVGSRVEVASGENWHSFVDWTLSQQMYGLENLALIPGTVGAGPIQNIGAYGSEISKFITSVKVYDFKMKSIRILNKEECEFGYRTSIFKNTDRFLLISIFFELLSEPDLNLSYQALTQEILSRGLNEKDLTPRDIFHLVSNIRKRILPNHNLVPNVGSFFKNIYINKKDFTDVNLPAGTPVFEENGMIKISSGYLIEKAGWKGVRKGNVGVSDLHSLVLIAYEEIQGNEILELAKEIIEDIYKKNKVQLEIEPNLI